jgi:hypothetical protein
MSAMADLDDWMDEHSRPGIVWYVKRLSANDTLATGAHQAGPYVPKDFLFDIFPSLNRPKIENPDVWFELRIDSHNDVRKIRAVWYNNKISGIGTRNETRLTNFGGASSALLDPESTGALAVFAFHRGVNKDAGVCHVWVCDDAAGLDAERIEDKIGTVEPGKWRLWSIDHHESGVSGRSSCWLETHEIPPLWLQGFPTAAEIVRKAVELRNNHNMPVDVRLMQRRDCEFEIFRSVEQAVEFPSIQKGFATFEDFLNRSQSILQRRKARAGRSLELHTREIFIEEQLREGADFSHQPQSEPGKRPDFLFPSEAAYKNAAFPAEHLRMLAVKTTCKDRWRQVINEADRINHKHLLTLQEGVSQGQFREMREAGVVLVVPEQLKQSYPESVRPHLQTLESFIGDIRLLKKHTHDT